MTIKKSLKVLDQDIHELLIRNHLQNVGPYEPDFDQQGPKTVDLYISHQSYLPNLKSLCPRVFKLFIRNDQMTSAKQYTSTPYSSKGDLQNMWYQFPWQWQIWNKVSLIYSPATISLILKIKKIRKKQEISLQIKRLKKVLP